MNIYGRQIIFKGNYGYSTTISQKNQNGEYEKIYLPIQLPKGTELENKTFINITNGFLSFYKNKQGVPQIKAVVMEYELDNKEQQNIQQEREAIQNEQNYNYDFGELPF